ncbi:hypothetical protein ASPSYDRAFT_191418 [Aspergillus sydowii CBS 593.65]|uniref:Atos-like conserved domain-containing protein n=1 Tax=Aspergillus sydowii CBS 593.65 TaxID=1036612 RepID=A0A1L9TWC8_9EURO|nr:uncharacterized protein ASPSYDRAFT_191418 [Aspergillus sydowii CBS 593.65]OJJ63726.1 hypothetical protein ASPSYDRAFT_191418 [Aspergillus sydowii CBS 593.65]
MPIFQDPDSRQFYDLWSDDQQRTQDEHRHHPSWLNYHEAERNIDSSQHTDRNPYERRPRNLSPAARLHAHDREQLIHYIKTAESPKWPQYYSVDSESDNHMLRTPEKPQMMNEQSIGSDVPENFPDRSSELASPAEIERPRSALHSGDFREGTPELERQQQIPQSPIPDRRTNIGLPFFSSSPTTPWFAPSFPSRTQTAPLQALEARVSEANRSPAPSLGSFSSSYVLKTPTSPLVHQANNTDLDFSPRTDSEDPIVLFDKANRRRTLPPDTFRDLQAQSGANHPIRWDWLSNGSRNPHRSLASSYSLQLASSVQGHSPRPRRPSLSSEVSYRTHAPMVGSYEESILRGRMSTCPSKPLDFTAQIGVLGKSKTKAGLKCPPHVTVPFPAVFYSYPTSGNGRTISDDSPSPYVGTIDLENSLPRDASSNNRRRRRPQSPVDSLNSHRTTDVIQTKQNEQETLRRIEKRHRRTESPKSPSGGCYRIPEQGQLQVMIKNPNKTAVKLFLVPYDLSDMEPGTKTFIRQRSYSAGPIIDMPLSARSNYGTDRPEASLSNSDDPKDKPVLRYLIHLNICCPSRGRYYLHSSIRVVFANRVPDGKEKLRNEIQHPEPRYSPYKSSREPNSLRVNSRLSAEKGPRGTSPRPPNFRASDERPPHPFRPIPSIRSEIVPLGSPAPSEMQTPEQERYSKLNKGDAGYGGCQLGSTGSPEGESLLARKLRGLDVHNPDRLPEGRGL